MVSYTLFASVDLLDQSSSMRFLALALLSFCLLSCDERKDFVIDSPGFYELKGDSIVITVFKDKNGLLNIRTVFPGSEGVCKNGWIDPERHWEIYVETPKDLWLTTHESLAYLFDSPEISGIYGVLEYPSVELGGVPLKDKVPIEVIERLPTAVALKYKRLRE